MEFEVGGNRYQAARMPVRTQFHVARRLGPALLFLATLKTGKENVDGKAFAIAVCSSQVSLNTEDCDYAMDACLEHVQRFDNGAWAPMKTANTPLMYEVELPELLQVVWHVLVENKLVDFFSVPPTGSKGAGTRGRRSNGQASQTEKGLFTDQSNEGGVVTKA